MNLVSSIGLVFDIIGVLILFKYGLPSKIQNHKGSIIREEGKEEEKARKKENKKIKQWANLGLILILIGFLLQLIGTNINCI